MKNIFTSLIPFCILLLSLSSCQDKPKPPVEEPMEKPLKGSCSGPCEATGFASNMTMGDCPDPCDAQTIKDLRKEAKKNARKNAITKCIQHDPDCICADGKYTKISEDCIQVLHDSLGNNDCIYLVTYKYKGTCKTIR